jgi:hypothetical protein
MSERDWARESVTVYEEGKTRSPEEVLTEPERLDHPLDALPVEDCAFIRVVYGLDPSWEDVQYIAKETCESPHEVLEQIQAVYRKNVHRRVDYDKMLEKVVRAYSRLTELAGEEQNLEEEQRALSHQRPVDGKRAKEVATKLQRTRERMTQLLVLQEKWHKDSRKVPRIPSKDVARIFNLSPAAVDQRVSRLKPRLRELLDGWEKHDEP